MRPTIFAAMLLLFPFAASADENDDIVNGCTFSNAEFGTVAIQICIEDNQAARAAVSQYPKEVQEIVARVVKAVQDAAAKFLHISSDYWHEEMTALAERLSALVPLGEPGMCFFCQSGTESVEGALKLARYVTKRGPHHRLPRQLPRPHHGLAVADVQQVHAAGGILPDHAGRDARALPESVSAAVRGRRPGQGGARLHPHAVRAQCSRE